MNQRNACTVIAVALSAALLGSCGDDTWDPPGNDGATEHAPTTIHAFGATGSPANDGMQPKGSLTAVTTNGNTVLYGRTAVGGPAGVDGCGIVFSINPDGTNYQILYSFGGADGCDPRHDAMTLNPNDGKFYATTQGVNQGTGETYGNYGQIFSFTPGAAIAAGKINAVHTFKGGNDDGAEQHSSFSIDPVSQVLYGQSAAGGTHDDGLLYSVTTSGAFTPLHSFKKSDGSDPHGRIVLFDGTLYGIVRSGGTLPKNEPAYGGVFAFSPPAAGSQQSGTFAMLHTFAGGPKDGALSDHGYLTPVQVGNKTILFGMTECGGTGTDTDAGSCQSYTNSDAGKSYSGGAGVIFQIDPSAEPGSDKVFSIVYSFQGQATNDGAAPYGSLMYDGTYLYGTTSAGGKHNNGTVFRIAPVAFGVTATPTIIHHFDTTKGDGSKPIDNVIRVGNMLYGMTVFGGNGATASGTGNGTIFAIPIPAN